MNKVGGIIYPKTNLVEAKLTVVVKVILDLARATNNKPSRKWYASSESKSGKWGNVNDNSKTW